MVDEPVLLTETQWRILDAKRECVRYGHDWEILSNYLGLPVSMHCARPCDVGSFKIEPFRKKDD